LVARATALRENRAFARRLEDERKAWNERYLWKVGGAPTPASTDRADLYPPGLLSAVKPGGVMRRGEELTLAGLARQAEREWPGLVRRIVDEFFPSDAYRFPKGLSHPASPYVASCLISGESRVSPRAFIVSEEHDATYYHPYPEALERILNLLIGQVKAAGSLEEARELAVAATKAYGAATKDRYAWAFIPHIDDSRKERQSRAVAMRRQGYRVHQIAASFGIDEKTAGRWVRGVRRGDAAPAGVSRQARLPPP
jgi:hypothetical protein